MTLFTYTFDSILSTPDQTNNNKTDLALDDVLVEHAHNNWEPEDMKCLQHAQQHIEHVVRGDHAFNVVPFVQGRVQNSANTQQTNTHFRCSKKFYKEQW